MKIRSVICLLVLALTTLQAHAHLGDALPVIVARLGTPQIPNGVDDDQAFYGKDCVIARRYFFGSGRYTIDVYIIDQFCVRIEYSKAKDQSQSWLSNASTWTDAEIGDLLTKNSEGKTWSELPPSTSAINSQITRKWKRSDGGVATQAGTEFDILGPTYLQAVASAQAKSKAESEKVPNL